MNPIRKIRSIIRQRELKRFGLRHVDDAWIEGPGGWRVKQGCDHPADPVVFYKEGNRLVGLEAGRWHESKTDRQADITVMTDKQFMEWLNKQILRIRVPEEMQWSIIKSSSPSVFTNTGLNEPVSFAERERMLQNIKLAYEFVNEMPMFVRVK